MLLDFVFIAVIGLSIGSFLNAWLWRTHEGISILGKRSMCPNCEKNLRWIDLLPLLSYIALKGKCRYCSEPISWQYPAIEFLTATVFLIVYAASLLHNQVGLAELAAGQASLNGALLLMRDFFFVTALLFIALYDLRWLLILDQIILPTIVLTFLLNGFLLSAPACGQSFVSCFMQSSWANLLGAMAIGAGFFFVQYILSRGRWIGGGDIRLGALMGAMVGFPGILIALFLSYMIGSVVGIGLLAARKAKLGNEIPFAPFLVFGTMATLLFQKELLGIASKFLLL